MMLTKYVGNRLIRPVSYRTVRTWGRKSTSYVSAEQLKVGIWEQGSQPDRLCDRPFLPIIPLDMEARLSWSAD